MDNEIDGIIAEASATEPTPQETPVDKPEADKVDEVSQDDGKKPETQDDDTPWPKKAQNALSRRDKKIWKLQAELNALKAAQTQPQAQNPQQSNKSDGAPREEDFDNYGDYLKASFKYDMQQEQAKTKADEQTQQVNHAEAMWKAEREQAIVQSFDGHRAVLPDFNDTIAEAIDIADDFPPEIEKIFLSAKDPALAFYNLAKEGKLEALATMTPYEVMREVALAEMKRPEVKKVSSAPAPISAASGASRTTKRVDDMTGDELLKKYNLY